MKEEMKKSKQLSIINLLVSFVFLITIALAVSAQESAPQLPHGFYGTSNIDGENTPVGIGIIAKVNGEEKGRITTTETGTYGAVTGKKLIVQGEINDR